uniref:Phosphoribosylglycinamide formyltransferase, chloroplastic n=1 Tax=Nicotiana tabacum TaxID=4097 RepID=A0A1S4CJR1_TOBAC|nr:PREDICTED: phosphoribosylglycinamide formyltransferase, chloroplastic-like [Nicotiana tabacum]
MEAQRLSFGLSSTLSTSPIQNQKYPIFKIPSFSYTSPNNLPLKGFFLKPHFSFAPKKIFQCINCLEGIEKQSVTVPNNSGSKELKKKNLVVFVSGGGSNFRSIYEATIEGTVHGEVAVLVTNKHDCGGAKYAREQGIPVILFPKAKDKSEGLSEEDLVGALRTYNIDFILLAGYLKLIPTELVQAFPRSIFNIHPSLLPAFGGKGYYGMKVHKAVIASGARYSGPTIHYVDEHYDTGRILAQRVVPVLANDTADTLAARVLKEEHKLYVEVAAALCEERIVWRQDGVPLIQSKEDPNHYK